jgi:hypothetical protein
MTTPSPHHLGTAFTALSRAVALPTDLVDHEQIVETASSAVPTADHVAFAVTDSRGRVREFAASDPVAGQLDVVQRELHEGPGLGPVTRLDDIRVDDLQRGDRWPRFAMVAARVTPVRSLLVVRTPLAGQCFGALSFYADHVAGFESEDAARGRLVAAFAANCLNRQAAKLKADNLELALASAATIGTAIGILVARERLSRADAFDRLRVASQNLHRKLHDVATDVCETGTLPDDAGRPH